MTIEFNILCTLVAIWLVAFVNFQFLEPTRRNMKRFRLYKLRDGLAHLAMTKVVEENSEQYKLLMHLLNSAIRVTGTFKVTDFISYILAYHRDKELQKNVSSLKNEILAQENKAFCDLASDIFEALSEMLDDDTRVLRKAIAPLEKLACIVRFIRDVKVFRKAEYRLRIVDEVDQQWESLSNELSRGGSHPSAAC